MNDKKITKTINLSPIILNIVSILAIILIIANIVMNLIFSESIQYNVIIPLIGLYFFCRYYKDKR